MDRISFLYWKRNAIPDKTSQKAYLCVHNGYTYGKNMDIASFRFVYIEAGEEKFITAINNNFKIAYLKFLEVICSKSEQTFSNFRNSSAEKFKIYTEEEKNGLTESQLNDTRLKEISIKGTTYYVATNLNISEYINNIADKLSDEELDKYYMELNQNISEVTMNKAATTNVFYLKKTTSSECDNGKQFGISREVIREFFEVPDTGNTNITIYGEKHTDPVIVEIQTATDPRLANAGFRDFLYKEGDIKTGDYILFTKIRYREFFVKIIKQGTKDYESYGKLFLSDNDKHAGLYTEKGDSEPVTNNNYAINNEQIIYYGVPGSGKSYKIDKIIENVSNEQKMRVVFHPEYTNADFIGQILPIEDNGVDYRFKAGPFTRILKRALQNPSKPYYLVIEEINRGNAAAIFGDLFQLLDRNENGFSSYPIENIDINSFIRSSNNLHNDKIVPSTVQVGNINYTENTEITLPPNLAIFATMNTSDQNVFTLDNAFQRRWRMELVENKFNIENPDELTQSKAKLEGFDITWGDFQKKINTEISKQAVESGLSSMEDKRLGCWFVKPDKTINSEKTISQKLFSEKVLKYLWDDAFKFVRTEVFENEFQTLEDLSNAYQNGTNIFRDKSFLSSNPVENV